MWMTTTKTTTDDGAWVYYTEKVMRPPHNFSSSSENKIRSIKIDDHMNNSISNSCEFLHSKMRNISHQGLYR